MPRRKPIDRDAPPTRRQDWIGAEVLAAGERHSQRTGHMTFYVFRASNNARLFAITDAPDGAALPPCPRGGTWELFKSFPETGKPRVGFSEAEAKRGISQKGYHLVRIDVRVSESA